MKHTPSLRKKRLLPVDLLFATIIQAPLPFPFDKLPKRATIEGRGTVNGGTAPSAPREETTNE